MSSQDEDLLLSNDEDQPPPAWWPPSSLLAPEATSITVRIWPWSGNSLRAGARVRRTLLLLGVVVGFPLVAGLPLLASTGRAIPGDRSSWLDVAVPWWIILSGYAFVALAAWARQAEPSSGQGAGQEHSFATVIAWALVQDRKRRRRRHVGGAEMQSRIRAARESAQGRAARWM